MDGCHFPQRVPAKLFAGASGTEQDEENHGPENACMPGHKTLHWFGVQSVPIVFNGLPMPGCRILMFASDIAAAANNRMSPVFGQKAVGRLSSSA
jgi:hypothetical protein